MSIQLEKFIVEKRKEVQEFCVTCREGGFNEENCDECDLYTLALEVKLADWIEEKEDTAETRACANCDQLEHMMKNMGLTTLKGKFQELIDEIEN